MLDSTKVACFDVGMVKSRPEGKPLPKKIFVTLPSGARRLFDQLVSRKFYGEKDAEVARHLVIMKLDELVEKKRLEDVPPEQSWTAISQKQNRSFFGSFVTSRMPRFI